MGATRSRGSSDQALVLDDHGPSHGKAPQDNLAHDRGRRGKLSGGREDRVQLRDQDAGIPRGDSLRAKEIEITPEMLEAGVIAYENYHDAYWGELLVAEIYKAMVAALDS
jgi:hypothetical protein